MISRYEIGVIVIVIIIIMLYYYNYANNATSHMDPAAATVVSVSGGTLASTVKPITVPNIPPPTFISYNIRPIYPYTTCPNVTQGNCTLTQAQAIQACTFYPEMYVGYSHKTKDNNNYYISGPGLYVTDDTWTTYINSDWLNNGLLSIDIVPSPTIYQSGKSYSVLPNSRFIDIYPECPGTNVKGACILDEYKAATLCNSDPVCTGYVQNSGNSTWMKSTKNGYMLTKGTNIMEVTGWDSYIKN